MQIGLLGSTGMAGHMIYDYLKSKGYDVTGFARYREDMSLEIAKYMDIQLTLDYNKNLYHFEKWFRKNSPDVLINCIGLLVQACENNPSNAVYVNSWWPHYLEDLTKDTNTKVIHLSTDCVFDGKEGFPYKETDKPTETNWYGRTKSMGELNNNKDLTIRMSIVGPELKQGAGLFQWFMNQTEKATGYANVYWNGMTTLELAKQIELILDTNLTGIYHLAPNVQISKYTLLRIINIVFERKIKIKKDLTLCQNKTLYNVRLNEYGPHIPDYRSQLVELKEWMKRLD